jgi:phosphomevalonate kinase
VLAWSGEGFEREEWMRVAKLIERIQQVLREDMTEKEREELREMNEEYLSLLRRISEESGVAIMPKPAEEFIREFMKDDRILFCAPPGAGGFDALFFLYFGSQDLNEIDSLAKGI